MRWPSAAARRCGARRLPRMAEIYVQRFADRDGRIRATFEVIWLSAGRRTRASRSRCARARRKRGLEAAVKRATEDRLVYSCIEIRAGAWLGIPMSCHSTLTPRG